MNNIRGPLGKYPLINRYVGRQEGSTPPLYRQTLKVRCVALLYWPCPTSTYWFSLSSQNDCCNNGGAAKCKVYVVKGFFTAQQYPASTTIRKFKFCMGQRKWVKNVYAFGLVQLKVAEQTWQVQKQQILTTDGWPLLSSTSI